MFVNALTKQFWFNKAEIDLIEESHVKFNYISRLGNMLIKWKLFIKGHRDNDTVKKGLI